MTKLLTIDVDFEKTTGECLLRVNVISENKEGVEVISDLLLDKGILLSIKPYSYAIYTCLQQVKDFDKDICYKAVITVKIINKNKKVSEVMRKIASLINNFTE